MGMSGYSHDQYLATIDRYSGDRSGMGEGALVIFADDAEYVGTNGWCKLKYQNQPDHVVQKVPDAQQKLIVLVEAVKMRREFATFVDPRQSPGRGKAGITRWEGHGESLAPTGRWQTRFRPDDFGATAGL